MLFLHTMVNRNYYHINKLSNLNNFDEYLKLILHFGLVAVSFPQTYAFYDTTPIFNTDVARKIALANVQSQTDNNQSSFSSNEKDSIDKSLKKHFKGLNEINLELMHPYPEESTFAGLLSKMIFVYETRMKESGYSSYYKDIGIYECSCGLSYSLENCGMASVAAACGKCGQQIGGSGHVLI